MYHIPWTQEELGADFSCHNCLLSASDQIKFPHPTPALFLCSWNHNPHVCLGRVLGFSDLLCLLSINTQKQ